MAAEVVIGKSTPFDRAISRERGSAASRPVPPEDSGSVAGTGGFPRRDCVSVFSRLCR